VDEVDHDGDGDLAASCLGTDLHDLLVVAVEQRDPGPCN
jgi:hypothetical protein